MGLVFGLAVEDVRGVRIAQYAADPVPDRMALVAVHLHGIGGVGPGFGRRSNAMGKNAAAVHAARFNVKALLALTLGTR
jgi:hypothetical protein